MAVTTQHPDPRGHHNGQVPAAECDAVLRHRVDVVRRLLERGLSARSIAAILQGWESEIAAAVAAHRSAEVDADRG